MTDLDEVLRQGKRREAKQSLVIGGVLVAAAIALWLGMRSLSSGGVSFAAPVTGLIGLGLIVRGLFGGRTEL